MNKTTLIWISVIAGIIILGLLIYIFGKKKETPGGTTNKAFAPDWLMTTDKIRGTDTAGNEVAVSPWYKPTA